MLQCSHLSQKYNFGWRIRPEMRIPFITLGIILIITLATAVQDVEIENSDLELLGSLEEVQLIEGDIEEIDPTPDPLSEMQRRERRRRMWFFWLPTIIVGLFIFCCNQ